MNMGVDARYVLLAAGFGDGEHFAQVLQCWRKREAVGTASAATDSAAAAPAAQAWGTAQALHYIAIVPSLPSAAGLALPELQTQWPVNVPGLHRLVMDGGRITLDVLVGELEASLLQLEARIDAFYLPHPIAPLRALARLALPGAVLELRGADETQLAALRSAGFSWPAAGLITTAPWTGGDPAASTNAIHARYTSRKPQAPRAAPPDRRAIVIGAGMAGAAMCERLAARGWDVTVIERHAQPAQEASGNRSGIFMPLLSRDDNIPARLSRAAYLYALRYWQGLGGLHSDAPIGDDSDGRIAGEQCGVLQLARDAEHGVLQQQVAAAWDYPQAYVRWLAASAASTLLGAATPHGGWLFGQGGWANPASLCRAMFDACGARLTRIFHAQALALDYQDGQWQVHAAGGALLASAPNVILANSHGARDFAQTAHLPLATMRGQVTHLDVASFATAAVPLVVCREAYLTPPVHGIISAGATYDSDSDPALRAASQAENLARVREILPRALVGNNAEDGDQGGEPALEGRVGFRCMAPDRLPLVGRLPNADVVDTAAAKVERLRDMPRHPGLYSALGYASRGLIWAPLAAELLASQLEHAPLPLEATLATALDPARFMLKANRKADGSLGN